MSPSVSIFGNDPQLGPAIAGFLRDRNPSCAIDVCHRNPESNNPLSQLGQLVIFTDMARGDSSGIALIRSLNLRQPGVRCLVLLNTEDPDTIVRTLEAGANGCLVKPQTMADTLAAVDDFMRGGTPLCSRVARVVVDYFNKRGIASAQEDSLTPRELVVLDLLSAGYRAKEVAERLGIGVDTVNTHVRHIYTKLHVSSRAEAVAKHLRSRSQWFPSNPSPP